MTSWCQLPLYCSSNLRPTLKFQQLVYLKKSVEINMSLETYGDGSHPPRKDSLRSQVFRRNDTQRIAVFVD